MGKASSSKKVARAAKAAGRPGAKRNYAWPAAIGAVVVLGVVLVVASLGGGDNSNEPPRIGDHWHAAYGVWNCDHYVAPFADEAGDRTGIHTHQDGLMHMHPFASRVTGTNANLEAFAEDVGMDLDDTSIKADGIDRQNGDDCGDGEPGTLRLLTWENPAQAEPTVRTEGIASYNPPDSSVWVLAFAPEDAEIPLPPSAINLQDPTAAEEGRQPPSATVPPEGETPEPGEETDPAEGEETDPAEGEDTEPAPPADEPTSTTAAP